jgi:hypothetical protein
VPYDGLSDPQIIKKVLFDQKLPHANSNEQDETLYDLFVNKCCVFNSKERAASGEIRTILDKLLKKLTAEQSVQKEKLVPRSTKHFSEDLKAMMQAMRLEILSNLAQMQQGINRIETSIADLSQSNINTMNLILAVANDELQFPLNILMLPVVSDNDSKTQKRSMFSRSKFNAFSKYIIIFFDDSMNPVTYDNKDGLEFDVLKDGAYEVASKGKSFNSFVQSYGPMLKLSAASLNMLIAAGTGIDLNSLFPHSFIGLCSEYASTKEFVTEYSNALYESSSNTGGPWDGFHPEQGLSRVTPQLEPLGRESYHNFKQFLSKMGYDKVKLGARPVAQGSDGKVHWVKVDANASLLINSSQRPSSSSSSYGRGAEEPSVPLTTMLVKCVFCGEQ